MKHEKSFWEYLSKEAELPDALFPGQSLIEIVGNRRVLIESHCGVKEYGDERICVKTRSGEIVICGNCLQLRCMTRSQLVISGCIHSVVLNQEGRL